MGVSSPDSGPLPETWEFKGSVHCISAVPRIALFWTETSDVVPWICWSCSPSLWLTASSAPVTTGTTVASTPHIFSSSCFSPWHFLSFSCSFFVMLLLLGIAPSITSAFFCCLLINTMSGWLAITSLSVWSHRILAQSFSTSLGGVVHSDRGTSSPNSVQIYLQTGWATWSCCPMLWCARRLRSNFAQPAPEEVLSGIVRKKQLSFIFIFENKQRGSMGHTAQLFSWKIP